MRVVCNGRIRKRQNRLGRAVVLLQFIHLCLGIYTLKAENVLNFRAAPAVDGLIVIAHDKQISVHRGKTFDDLELHGVGVLELVHMHIAESARKIGERLGVLL